MEGTVNALAITVENRDPYTAGHQQRVAQLACAIAKEIGLSQCQINSIHVAGTLHDIGKIYVPAEILSKPGRLSDERGKIIVKQLPLPNSLSALIIPPCASMIVFAMLRPRPVPSVFLEMSVL
ncbi:HD-GYP domain-containing protein [Dissulfurispira sp.]|uniref:HD-GYP domain-containing protein n=1 Tax=Dissulfurispira sp. TaxID=2817609 RepID=UPI003FA60F03